MLNQHSTEEIAEIYSLLDGIKQEYQNGIKPIILKTSPDFFKNPHTVPKLKKIQINRGLGLAAIGAGIDLATGRTLTAVHRTNVVAEHPDTLASVIGVQIPHFDTMMAIAARCNDMTGLG